MVRFGDNVLGNVLDELAFCLQWVFAAGSQAEAFTHAEDMGVHRHGGLVPNDGTDYIRGLAANALQRLQIVDIVGNNASIYLCQALRHLY